MPLTSPVSGDSDFAIPRFAEGNYKVQAFAPGGAGGTSERNDTNNGKIITAAEAAALIPDGATVGLAGMGLSGWPEEVACAIRDSFKQTATPAT